MREQRRTETGKTIKEASIEIAVKVLQEVNKPLTGMELLDEAIKMGLTNELRKIFDTEANFRKGVIYYFITHPRKKPEESPFIVSKNLKNAKVALKDIHDFDLSEEAEKTMDINEKELVNDLKLEIEQLQLIIKCLKDKNLELTTKNNDLEKRLKC